MGYDQAVFLVTTEFLRNGDIDTGRITIGAPDYSWSNSAGMGNHGEFEQDASIARDDKGISGDAVTIDMEAYKFTWEICKEVSGGLYDINCMAQVRKRKWERSVALNPNFTFGPLQLILYGAASHLYELFPSGAHDGIPAGQPDGPTIDMIFGVIANKDRTVFTKDIEWLPPNWWTRNSPYTLPLIATQVNSFDVIDAPGFTNGFPDDQSPEGLMCLLGNLILQNDLGADGSGGLLGPPLDPVRKAWAHSKLEPIFKQAFPSCVLSII
ncbi:hypothetical protein T439DRAFT_328938 [Meredithblackwellia eburnea MCA 4105]